MIPQPVHQNPEHDGPQPVRQNPERDGPQPVRQKPERDGPQPVRQKPERDGPPHHTTKYINIFGICIAVLSLGLGIIIAAGWNWYTNSQPPHKIYKSECKCVSMTQ